MTDEEIHAVFHHVLAEDPDCPLTDKARKYGPSPEGLQMVTYLMAGFLISVVWKLHGETLGEERAVRIVGDHFRRMR